MKTRALVTALLIAGLITGISSCSKENGSTNTIQILSVTPSSPADMPFGEFILIRYEYQIDHPEGARMWIQPYTNGEITPGFSYSSSKIYSGIGSREVGVSVKQGDAPIKVDQFRIVMVTPEQEDNLYEKFMDVNFTFK